MPGRVLCLVQPERKRRCHKAATPYKEQGFITMPYLVKSVDFFSICRESHESSVQINKAANHKVLLTDSCLLGVAELSSPHHVAVAAFDAEDRTGQQQNSFIFVTLDKKTKALFFWPESRNVPVVDVALVVADGDSNVPHFVHVKVKVVLVVVRRDPTDPHPPWLLARKDSHRVIVLEKEEWRE